MRLVLFRRHSGIIRAKYSAVDNLFRPCDATGQPIADNVHLAGSILTGYDYAREKSGNGVAVVTGYQAALCAISGVKK